MAKTPGQLSFEPLKKTLASLESALTAPPKNDLERDGVIQRFEYSFELSWKAIRTLLIALGRSEVSGSPKPLFREAASEGLLPDSAVWFRFLEARNQTVHSYNSMTAEEVYQAAKAFPAHARPLLLALEKKAET